MKVPGSWAGRQVEAGERRGAQEVSQLGGSLPLGTGSACFNRASVPVGANNHGSQRLQHCEQVRTVARSFFLHLLEL